MNLRIGTPYKRFHFYFKVNDGEVELFCCIKKEKKQYFWLLYSNAEHDNMVWKKTNGKYHFCLRIPKVITIDTTYLGKKLWGRLNLTSLFNESYTVPVSGDDISSTNLLEK